MATPSIIAIDLAITAAGYKLRGVRGAPGVVVVRKISGSDEWSQHSYGNATDYYGPPGALDDLRAFIRALPNARTVCYNGKGGCTTPHRDHVHVDAWPKYSGTPGGSDITTSEKGSGTIGGMSRSGAPATWRTVGATDQADGSGGLGGLFSLGTFGGIETSTLFRFGEIVAGSVLALVGLIYLFRVLAPGAAAATGNLVSRGAAAAATGGGSEVARAVT